jgi:hypothetical protein
MKRYVGIFVLLALVLTGFSVTQAQTTKIVVYSALPDLETTLVHREFTKRTGIQVEALSVAAAGTLAALGGVLLDPSPDAEATAAWTQAGLTVGLASGALLTRKRGEGLERPLGVGPGNPARRLDAV